MSTTTQEDNEMMDILQQVWEQHSSSSTAIQNTATLPPSHELPFNMTPLSIMEEPSLLLIVAVIIEMIVPYIRKIKVSGLEETFLRLGHKVNRPHDSSQQHFFAGIMLPLLIIAVCVVPFYFITYFTKSDGVISLVLLCLLLELKFPQNTALAVYSALRQGNKEEAKKRLSTFVLRDTKMLSPMGIAKAAVESTVLRIVSGYLAIMFWFIVGGIEVAILMQVVNVMNHAFNGKLERNIPFGRAIFTLQQIMLLPVALLLLLLLLFSANPTRHFSAAFDAMKTYPAPVSGMILGAIGANLDLSLGGPRYYAGKIMRLPRIGGSQVAKPESILYAMRKIRMSSLIFLIFAIFLDINFFF